MLSQRQQKFMRLIRAANDQPTDWLIANVRSYNKHATPLSILACLRIIAGRIDTSGLPYHAKMRAVKSRILGNSHA